MNSYNSYTNFTRINYTNYYYNSHEEYKENQLCLEEIKQDYLKKESVKLVISAKTVESVFSKDIINRWISLLKENFQMKFEYEQNENTHIIKLKYSDFNIISELYICLVLVRYLWYKQNNFLVYRILHILDNSSLNLFESIKLAHFYDCLDRDDTFNIFQTLIIPMDLGWVDFKNYLKYSNKIHECISKMTYRNISIINLIKNFIKFKPLSENYNELNYDITELYSQLQYTYNELEEIKIVLDYFKYPYTSINQAESYNHIKRGDIVISLHYSSILTIIDPEYSFSYALSHNILNNDSQLSVYKTAKQNTYILK